MAVYKITKGNSIFLDGLRGISAQVVLLGHLLSLYYLDVAYINSVKIQNIGVVVFFIISGFLIFFHSMKKGTHYGFRNYIIDRFTRIFVPLIPSLLLTLILDSVLIKIFSERSFEFDYTLKSFTSSLLLIQNHPIVMNMFETTSFGFARPLWTVSVEWLFYIFYGLMFYGAVLFKARRVVFVSAISVMFIVPFYYLGGRGLGLTYYWLFGLVVAALFIFYPVALSRKTWLYLALGAILGFLFRVFGLRLYEIYDVGGGLLIAASFYFLLNLNSDSQISYSKVREKLGAFFVFLSSYSYSLYLVHYSIIIFGSVLLRDLQFNPWLSVLILFLISNICSYLFYLTIERHHSVFRDRLKNYLRV